MDSEANLPEMPASPAPPPALADSDNGAPDSAGAPGTGKSRRRRRKRKKKGSGEGQPAGENAGSISAEGGEAQPRTEASPNTNTNTNSNNNNGGGQQQQANGGKRWKKKFRSGSGGSGGGDNRPPRPEPGNSLYGSNGGGGRRNRTNKQRGPRAFVGPMDHSYREASGNYADTPPSTIEMQGNMRRHEHRQSHFREDRLPPELLTSARPVAIPDDAPTHIYFFIDELFLTAKIQETARQQGVKVAFVKPDKDIVSQLSEMEENEHPSLIVFDLNSATTKPLTLIPKLKAKLKKGTAIIGFLTQMQNGELKAKATEAGCNTVMAKSAFSQNLPNLLRRYGIVEEEEPNFNQ